MRDADLMGMKGTKLKRITWIAVTFSLLVFQMLAGSCVNAYASSSSENSFVFASPKRIPVTGVTLSKSSLVIKEGSSGSVKATVIPSNATDKDVYWDSSDTDIAKVDTGGRVTGVEAGTATITVATEDGNFKESYEVTITPDPNIVTFADSNLEQVVRNQLNKTTGKLYKVDVHKITNLDAHDKSITDLSGIENLTGLTYLNLNGSSDPSISNQISDISCLAKLTKLSSLLLSNNQIDNIEVLSKLKSLTGLSLDGNQITDIGPLNGLTKLKTLKLSNNQISDIYDLKKLTSLKTLNLENNQIENINVLRVLKNLKHIYLKQNPIDVDDVNYLKANLKGWEEIDF